MIPYTLDYTGSRTVGAVVATLLSSLFCAGCSGPALASLDLSSAEIAGDSLLVMVHAYSYDMPLLSHVAEISDSRYYVLRYPLCWKIGGFGAPEVARISAVGVLGASYSGDRLVIAEAPETSVGRGRWSLEVVEWKPGGTPTALKTWDWPRDSVSSPPFALSNDGRYVARVGIPLRILDTATLVQIGQSSLLPMFEGARKIVPHPDEYLRLTQNLGYLVFRPAREGPNGSAVLVVDGHLHPRENSVVAISRRTAQISVYNDELESRDGAVPGPFFQGAAESNTGALLLLYSDYDFRRRAQVLTMRDSNMKIVHRMRFNQRKLEPGETVGPAHAWDPTHHRILVYNDSNLAKYPRPQQFVLWDYEAGTTKALVLDVFQAFRLRGNRFVLAQAGQGIKRAL
ncbi:MAG TPA: hypothetical protein VFC78_14790 [Tepidisphaeraceae bacterium]|nr:hypothetical protein [Tepidisphaeraceae bacterium]